MSDRTPQPTPRQIRHNPEVTGRIGANIARARLAAGFSQTELARELDGWTAGNMVSRWERGVHRPHRRTLERLAEVFSVDVDWFFEDHEEAEAA